MRIGPYRFSFPSLWPALLALATLVLLLQLGFWQWHRAAEKEAMLADFARAGSDVAPPFSSVKPSQFDSLRFATVEIAGHFDRDEVIYLDNRSYGGQLGYHVLGVFEAEGHDSRMLVNLGWVPLDGGRETLPAVALPEGAVRFLARLKPISNPILALGTALDVRDGRRLVMPVLDKDVLAKWLGVSLLSVEALVDPGASFGYTRVWQAHYDIPPVKHRAYAFQWFALAFAVLAIFVMVNTRREPRPGERLQPLGEDHD